jgi:hypothetical protein
MAKQMMPSFSLKTQIPSTKFQINLKFQYLMTKTFQGKFVSGGLDIRILVIGICLIFGISTRHLSFNKANPLWG